MYNMEYILKKYNPNVLSHKGKTCEMLDVLLTQCGNLFTMYTDLKSLRQTL